MELVAKEILGTLRKLDLLRDRTGRELQNCTRSELEDEAVQVQDRLYRGLYAHHAYGIGGRHPDAVQERKLRVVEQLLGEAEMILLLEPIHERWSREFGEMLDAIGRPVSCELCEAHFRRLHLNDVVCLRCEPQSDEGLPF